MFTTPDKPDITPKVHDPIKALCAQMARSLHGSPDDHTVLNEQIQILNALFHATLAEQLNLKPGQYGHSSAQGWMDVALKIQKQCVETVRTQQASKYMASLSANTIPSTPSPKMIKRNDEAE